MVTMLYLIRHGETEGAETNRYKGSIDVPLSARGEAQMRSTAEFVRRHVESSPAAARESYLRDVHEGSPFAPKKRSEEKEERLAAIYASNLLRASRSAEVFAGAFGIAPVVVPALKERYFGIWEGMTFPELRERHPAEFTAWAGDPLTHSPMGGETTWEVKERVMPALEEIVSRHRGKPVAVISHGGVIRVALCVYLGVPLQHIFRIEQDNAAVNIIEFWKAYPVVKLVNGGPQTQRDT